MIANEQVDHLIDIFDALNAVGVNDWKIQKAVRNITRRPLMTLDFVDLCTLTAEQLATLTQRLGVRLRELQEASSATMHAFNQATPSPAITFAAFTLAAQFQTESAFNMHEWESGIEFEEP
jgi:hypothetical protein